MERMQPIKCMLVGVGDLEPESIFKNHGVCTEVNSRRRAHLKGAEHGFSPGLVCSWCWSLEQQCGNTLPVDAGSLKCVV